ncbi:sugar ABC transporter permease [Clostridium polyendosporum]|uniref:Sugar ABC transporter permease n=2 Tax=Clostridium polyendosporum TaxID=69208 RepID=A0A919S1A5_9CLOT|nr:sugar ABC transporter permease [Clostridium polyendosporum]
MSESNLSITLKKMIPFQKKQAVKEKGVDIIIYLMTIPAVLLFAAFHTFPVLQGIYYSFTNWDGLSLEYNFIGLKNYLNLLKDANILNSYLFTFKFAIITTIIVNVLSLLIALGLNSKIKFKNFFRATYFLPNVLSMLIIGFIFNYIFANVLPVVGTKLGIEALAANILGNENLAWIGVVVIAVWQACAFNTILYLSGLQTVPEDIYEASALDGANKWQEFWKITFPIIAPFFTINMVLAMKNFLMVFDQVVALTGGGPGRATESIAFLIYKSGFSGGEFAYQSANSVVYFIAIIIISILQIKFLQKREVDM